MVYEILTGEAWAERTLINTTASNILDMTTTSTYASTTNATAESVVMAVKDYFGSVNKEV